MQLILLLFSIPFIVCKFLLFYQNHNITCHIVIFKNVAENNFVIYQQKINVREYRRGKQNGQSRETGNIGYTRRWKTKQTKQKHSTICVGHHYAQTKTNKVNTTWYLP